MPNLTPQKSTAMPSPSLSRVVLEQPRSIAKRFTELDLNPRSQEVFNKTYEVKSKARLHKTMLEEGNKLKENVWDVKGKPGEMMSYEQLLQGMWITQWDSIDIRNSLPHLITYRYVLSADINC